jgi:hypothetical protein
MEVHHHLNTARKKWSHYFWEFLMLFLAVFCGFLAEYQLEHVIEKDKEKQYMKSMLEDLASDTSMLQISINRAEAMEKGLDSLKNNLYDLDNIEKNILTIYRQNAVNLRLVVVSFSDQTTIQLRNSGGMRLIRKMKISNAISRYWRGISTLEFTVGNYKRYSDEREDLGYSIFNHKYSVRASTDSTTLLDNYFIMPEARLITNDRNLLINYANRTGRLQEFIGRFAKPQLVSQKLRAIDLIDLIKNEYQLK